MSRCLMHASAWRLVTQAEKRCCYQGPDKGAVDASVSKCSCRSRSPRSGWTPAVATSFPRFTSPVRTGQRAEKRRRWTSFFAQQAEKRRRLESISRSLSGSPARCLSR